MTDEYRKILDWCDRKRVENQTPYALLVFRDHPICREDLIPSWVAGIRIYTREDIGGNFEWSSNYYEDYTGSTPEEAIAKLAEALGL